MHPELLTDVILKGSPSLLSIRDNLSLPLKYSHFECVSLVYVNGIVF
jgi:hypothetical protein